MNLLDVLLCAGAETPITRHQCHIPMVDLENPCRVWIQVVDFSPHLSCLGSHSFVSISLSIPWLAQTWGAWYHWTFIFPHIRPYRTEGRAGRQLYSGKPAAPSRETSPWKKLAPWCCMNMNPLLTKMWYLYHHIHIHFWRCLTFIFIFCNSVVISCITTRTRSTLDLIWFWPVSSIYCNYLPVIMILRASISNSKSLCTSNRLPCPWKHTLRHQNHSSMWISNKDMAISVFAIYLMAAILDFWT